MSRLRLGALLLAASVIPIACGSDGYGDSGDNQSPCTADRAAATTSVSMVGESFSPACIKITAGQSVTWTNNSSLTHTVTSDAGAPTSFDSGSMGPGATFTFLFSSAGTVAYHCVPHASFGMRGTVMIE